MRVRIRWCGGCSPEIDREKLAQRLLSELKDLPGVELVSSRGPESEVLIFLAGCDTACPDRPENIRGARLVITIAGTRLLARQDDKYFYDARLDECRIPRIIKGILARALEPAGTETGKTFL